MENPVTLPSSKIVVDLSTIKTHLLSNNYDPFNRQPLTLDQVIPNDELKAEIMAWKQSKNKRS
jgi:ubiquitin conjugation factor E4 B